MHMNYFFELLKILLPAVIVFLTAFYLMRYYLSNEREKRNMEMKSAATKETIMLRLQAYERMILFLERVNPSAMVMRMNKTNVDAANFQMQLLQTIRSEFEHNIAQQLYVSNEAWQMLKNTKEEVIRQINLAKEKVSDTETAVTLSKILIANSASVSGTISSAIILLKKEASQLF